MIRIARGSRRAARTLAAFTVVVSAACAHRVRPAVTAPPPPSPPPAVSASSPPAAIRDGTAVSTATPQDRGRDVAATAAQPQPPAPTAAQAAEAAPAARVRNPQNGAAPRKPSVRIDEAPARI